MYSTTKLMEFEDWISNVHVLTHLQPQMAGMEETDAMLSMQIDTLGLAETNLSWTQDNKNDT